MHMGAWVALRLPTSNWKHGLRRIRVLGVYGDFALVEVQAKGRGSWREALDLDLLGTLVQADQAPAYPRLSGAGVCGCVVRDNDVALCDEGRRLWTEAFRDHEARAEYEEHMARVLAGC